MNGILLLLPVFLPLVLGLLSYFLPIRSESCNCKGHGNAVVLVAVNNGTVERFPAVDDHAVIGFLDIGSHGTEIFDHDGNAVGFLNF